MYTDKRKSSGMLSDGNISPGSTLSSFAQKASLRKAPVPPTRTSSFKEAVWEASLTPAVKLNNWSNLSESFSDHVQSQSSSDDLLSTSASRSGSFDQILNNTNAINSNKQTRFTSNSVSNTEWQQNNKTPDAFFPPPPPDFLLEAAEKKCIGETKSKKKGGSKNSLDEINMSDSGHSSPAPGFFNTESGRNCSTLPRKSVTISDELAEKLNRRRLSELNKEVSPQNMTQSLIGKKIERSNEKIEEESNEFYVKSQASSLEKQKKGSASNPTPELRKKVEDWQAGVEKCLNKPSKTGVFSVVLNKVASSPDSEGKQNSPLEGEEKSKNFLCFLKKIDKSKLDKKNDSGTIDSLNNDENQTANHFSKPSNHHPSSRLKIAALKEKRLSGCDNSYVGYNDSIKEVEDKKLTNLNKNSDSLSLKDFEKSLQQRLNNLKSPVKEDLPLENIEGAAEINEKQKTTLPTIRSRKFTKNSNCSEARKSQPLGPCPKSFSPSSRKSYLKSESDQLVINELKSLENKLPVLKPLVETKESKSTSNNVQSFKKVLERDDSNEPVITKEAVINSLVSFQNKINRLRKGNSFIANKLPLAKVNVNSSDDFHLLFTKCSLYVDSLPPQQKFLLRDVLCSLEKSAEEFYKSSLNTSNDKQAKQYTSFCEALKSAEDTFKK